MQFKILLEGKKFCSLQFLLGGVLVPERTRLVCIIVFVYVAAVTGPPKPTIYLTGPQTDGDKLTCPVRSAALFQIVQTYGHLALNMLHFCSFHIVQPFDVMKGYIIVRYQRTNAFEFCSNIRNIFLTLPIDGSTNKQEKVFLIYIPAKRCYDLSKINSVQNRNKK